MKCFTTQSSCLLLLCLLMNNITGADPVDYTLHIKPILKARCYACHGALKQQANLRLDAGHLIRKGADGGEVILPGNPQNSPLVDRISSQDLSLRMPPEGESLTPAQVDLVRTWILEGANSPENEEPEADPDSHWAFQLPQRAALPAPSDSTGPRNPIDAFVADELQRHGLTPQPEAPRSVLLRRVYLDLIGVPPSRDELLAFLADESTGAWATVVDRLLDDPRHGERWGRHWMDVWRYSDWYGRRDDNDVRNSASQIYRWRDWIVRSLNEGHGYDRMVREMLAADETCPEDYDACVATGYLIRNYYSLNANDWMRSVVEHTGKAFLGLTFNCAHCHDHKYDPIKHDDYFRLRAFFEPVYIRQDRVPGEADPGVFQDYTYAGSRAVQRLGAVRVFDKSPEATTWFYSGGDERNRATERGSIPPGVPEFLQPEALQINPVKLPPRAWYPGLRPDIQQTLIADASKAILQAETELSATKASMPDLSPELRDKLTQAEAVYAGAVQDSKFKKQPGAIEGQQSLVLDATTGRGLVQNRLGSLKALEQGSAIEFQLLILHDAHVNFQLVRDFVKGLTAGYLAFDSGRIMSYQPGSFSEFEAGRYDFEAGQSQFHVRLVVNIAEDRCLLTVRSTADEILVVDQVPVALNGWNPVVAENQGISFDARPGSVVVLDDFHLYGPAREGLPPESLVSCDFEPPVFQDGHSVVGLEGWESSPFGAAPATALVSRAAANRDLQVALQQLKLAQQAARIPLLRMHAAEAKLAAAQAELSSVETRIAADTAKYESSTESLPAGGITELIRTASLSEREAAWKKAEYDVYNSEVAQMDAESKPADDASRATAIAAAAKSLTNATAAVNSAKTALADDTLTETYPPFTPMYPRESTGRRKALAEWITSRDNPLTARVAVNHIWTRHFQSPLVSSVYDFGRNGGRPTHPELLDWLAVEFMESGWDMKHLHRLIATSEAYRRESSPRDAVPNVADDPENKLLWRMNVGRMESEVVRDSLLSCAGRLDLTMGGVELENSQSFTTHRRSLYYSVFPEAGGKSALGELFDAPDPLDCYRRSTSIVPQQALALTNSELVHQTSVALVKTWENQNNDDSAPQIDHARFITEMFEHILTRAPITAELHVCLSAFEQQARLAEGNEPEMAIHRARESLVRILLNHNDFVTIR